MYYDFIIIIARKDELDDLKSRIDTSEEKIMMIESELEARDLALKSALITKEAVNNEKV